MSNPFDDIRAAVLAARELNRAVDSQANTLCDLLEGRLRQVGEYRLKKLKRELRDFDATRGTWRQDK